MNIQIADPTAYSGREVLDRYNLVLREETPAERFNIQPLGIMPLESVIEIEAVDIDYGFAHGSPEKSKSHLSVACAQPPRQLGVYELSIYSFRKK